ncbi:fluoride efflux transporter CrcB [Frigoribacterium sp. 2-23]|uniref:fluoride efflux transporter CrcB n=1 Tax=Frigoribacterium sp. 2-23 TaxID=3415006 RepID=UPI003C6F15C9
MTPALFVGIALAGGVGASLRFVVDGVVTGRLHNVFPWGTNIINVTGSLLLGLVTGLALGGVVSHDWQLVLGTGLLGGYTTFSTASLQTVRLLLDGARGPALLNGLGMLVLCVAASGLGLWLGTLI